MNASIADSDCTLKFLSVRLAKRVEVEIDTARAGTPRDGAQNCSFDFA